MKKTFTLIAMLLLSAGVMAQTVTLTFSGRDANGFDRLLNHVVVKNLTKGWETYVYDGVLTIQNGVGIEDVASEKVFALSQNNPNPFDGTTFVNLQVAEQGDVAVQVTDITGRIVETQTITPLQPGAHQLRVTLSSAGVYFLTVRQAGRTSSVKMVCRSGGGADALAYDGMVDKTLQPKNDSKTSIIKSFDFGDQMEYVGYATSPSELSHTVTQALQSSEEIILYFDGVRDGFACPGLESVTDYDGNSYGTVRIGRQCWMQENLRTKHYANGTSIPSGGTSSSSGTPVYSSTSPYYYNYSTSGIPLWKSGYLYNWMAMTQENPATSSSYDYVQGVCPNGWHVPSETEWNQLTSYVKNRNEYQCDGNFNYFAKSLAANSTDWESSNYTCAVGNNRMANNATGFGVYPTGGFIDLDYVNAGTRAYNWSTKLINDTYTEYFFMESDATDAYTYAGGVKRDAYAVRCLRDNYDEYPWNQHACPGTPTVTDYDGNVYPTLQIGSQCWMRYNLRTTHYADGTSIPAGTTQNSSTPYYYGYSTSNVAWTSRGYLYNWPAVMHGASSSSTNPSGVQGICPVGWHVPSDAEWTQLESYVGSQSLYIWDNDSTYIARSLASISFWEESSVSFSVGSYPDANNATLFSAIPAGYFNGTYNNFGNTAIFWSTTNYTDSYAFSRNLYSYSPIVSRNGSAKNYGGSVRCVKD